MAAETESNEIDLQEIWTTVWKDRLRIVSATILFAVAAIAISMFIPNQYTAETVLAPATEDDGATSSLSSKLGGLANLAGINPKVALIDKTALALEHLNSRAFIAKFVRNHNYEVILVAGKKWDPKTREWIIDPKIFDTKSGKWVRKAAPLRGRKPSDWELHKKFSRLLNVDFETKTGIVRLKITSESPYTAKEWATTLVGSLNQYIRQKDIEQSKRNIEYLQDQISKTSINEMQRIFYQLIDQQIKKVMLAETKKEYVFEIIDPPLLPEQKSAPNRFLIGISAGIVGFMLSTFVTLLRQKFLSHR